jgi:hypothetical protein
MLGSFYEDTALFGKVPQRGGMPLRILCFLVYVPWKSLGHAG